VPGSLVGGSVPFRLSGGPLVERSVLVDLFVLFAAAKVTGELFEHFRQPAVVGELLAGILVGPHLLGWVGAEDQVLDVVAQLGVIILLFRAGLDTSVGDLREVGWRAVLVAVLGQAFGLAGGFGVMVALGFEGTVAWLGATAIVATSVGIAARVLADARAVGSPVGRTILAAAVIDDILAIVVLAVVVSGVQPEASRVPLVLTLLVVGTFLVVVMFAGPRLTRRLSRLVHLPGIPESPFLVAVLLTLGLAALSETIGLAAFVGAFLAGLVFEFRREEVATQVEPVYELLVPFFFAVTGSRLDPGVFSDPSVVGLAAALFAVAVASKVLSGLLGAGRLGRWDGLAVGVGMIPRGEVSLIVASLALSLGAFDAGLYGVVIALTVITALVTPPVLRPLLRSDRTGRRG
jgi:Kef-type K+ transport system membrane component KefB